MSEENKISGEETPALPPPVASPGRTGGGAGWVAGVAIVALVASGLAGWQAFEMRSQAQALRQELAGRLAAGDSLAQEARGVARQGQESLAALQAKVGAIESRLAESEGQAAALEALYQEFSRSRDERTLAEVEQAVIMAGQQLQLAGNVEAALVALQGAESRLALIDHARLQPLRRAIAADIEALRAVPGLDVAGLSIKLELLQGKVDDLPLAFAGEALPTPPESAPVASGPVNFLVDLGRELWREVQGLVRVERLDHAEPALLGPAQGAYLRENLKIRLLSARLGLLSRDGRAFGEDVRQAAMWVERYFDVRQAPVQQVLQDLKEIAAVKIPEGRPTLQQSLVALQALQTRPTLAAPPVRGQR
ncbi:MAG: uroporphyrinogen-III C-methyltransferase [Zoogloeaceae bacterium]|nr:uroporphyrinogen-III C-methyltransferase [Zoogloeaceae bacterium]